MFPQSSARIRPSLTSASPYLSGQAGFVCVQPDPFLSHADLAIFESPSRHCCGCGHGQQQTPFLCDVFLSLVLLCLLSATLSIARAIAQHQSNDPASLNFPNGKDIRVTTKLEAPHSELWGGEVRNVSYGGGGMMMGSEGETSALRRGGGEHRGLRVSP